MRIACKGFSFSVLLHVDIGPAVKGSPENMHNLSLNFVMIPWIREIDSYV